MYLIDDLEKVQKRATKILRQCIRLNYRQRLKFLNLQTLPFRRNRGDMIEVYKILTGKYDPTLQSILHRNINSNATEIVHISFQVWFMQIQLHCVHEKK